MAEKQKEDISFFLQPEALDLQDAPWGNPLETWQGECSYLEEMPQGVSRHIVNFINCKGSILAIKEMPAGGARHEYELLDKLISLRLPSVSPIGYIQLLPMESELSYLVTKYLERSIPYRNLFMNPTTLHSRSKLLDAMSGLLVQLHLNGVFWGDCSLSNTLFRHDAGALQAYLVDAESIEINTSTLSPELRFQDLQVMEENVTSEMLEIAEAVSFLDSITVYDTGRMVRQRYHQLWDEIHREEIVHPSEHYHIQERIRSLNNLGFSIRDISLFPTEAGDRLRVKIAVADRNFHRNQLLALTGLDAEEMQARKLLNEIIETRAVLSRDRNKEEPIEAAAFYWNNHIYSPLIEKLQLLIEKRRAATQAIHIDIIQDPVELYCQVLEHKWYLSERAQRDVGHETAVTDYINIMLEQDLHIPDA